LAILRDTLDKEIVGTVVLGYLLGVPERLDSAREDLQKVLGETTRELAKVLKKRSDLTQLLNDELVTVVKVRPKLVALKASEDRLRAEIQRAHREDAHLSMIEATRGRVHRAGTKVKVSVADAKQIEARWNDPVAMPLESKRRLIRGLYDVTVNPGRGGERIDIVPRYPLGEFPLAEQVMNS
jgi:septal ring factor EnvC (AmiA/AmiB activator)